MDTSLNAKKKRKNKKQELEGILLSGMLFIGDPQYMGANPQEFPNGDVPADKYNPFLDFNAFSEEVGATDKNLLLPDSFRDNPIGRGCIVQTQLHSGTYKLVKKFDKATGKLKSITIKIQG